MKRSSSTTQALIRGLRKMLKRRGSMTVDEIQLLEEVICFLRKHDALKGKQKTDNMVTIVLLLTRFFLDPKVNEQVTHAVKALVANLL